MAIKQRLHPSPDQVRVMVEHCHHARFVFNLGLEQRSMWRRSKHGRGTHPEYGPLDADRVTLASQMRELTALRGELAWLRAGSTVVQQAALRDLDRAFTNFFAGRAAYPQFKRRDDRAGGFVVRDVTVRRLNRKWGEVTIAKAGRVRFRLTRSWAEVTAATSARVLLRHGHWHVAFTTPPPTKHTPATGASIGIDRGVKNTLATSDGRMWHMPDLTAGEQARFLALEQRLARQTRAAKRAGRPLRECVNRTKTLDQLAVLRARLDNRRTNFVEQSTTMLARTCTTIGIEDLQVTNMIRRPAPRPDPEQHGAWLSNKARAKATLNRLIHASRWSQFHTRLTHKSDAVVVVPAAYSSQECRACGHTSSENRESQAVFSCTRCGHTNHADTNAAEVILDRALTRARHQPVHASAPNPRTAGARPHQPRTSPGRGNPTGRNDAA